MPTPEYQRFLASMTIGYEQWHDGIGYDLDALATMPPEGDERAQIEAILLTHLHTSSDWRDVEALAALGTETATAAVQAATKHHNPEVRRKALNSLMDPGTRTPEELEDLTVRCIELGDLTSAIEHNTPRVKRAVLDRARLADTVGRVHAAAMLFYLCGLTAEPFDWSQRTFFSRFGTGDMAELRAAWAELRARTGI